MSQETVPTPEAGEVPELKLKPGWRARPQGTAQEQSVWLLSANTAHQRHTAGGNQRGQGPAQDLLAVQTAEHSLRVSHTTHIPASSQRMPQAVGTAY